MKNGIIINGNLIELNPDQIRLLMEGINEMDIGDLFDYEDEVKAELAYNDQQILHDIFQTHEAYLNYGNNDREAAELYLKYWQIGESPGLDHPYTISILAQYGTEDEIAQKIIELGYPNPKEVVFDNEGCPMIQWRSENFDCEDYYTNILEEEN
jgi:hypothetical protein